MGALTGLRIVAFAGLGADVVRLATASAGERA